MWFVANIINLAYLITSYSHNAQVPKIVFFTGGNSLMPEDIYSSFISKYKTAFQILSLFLILIGSIYLDLQPLLNIGIYLFWLSTIITLISAYQYYKSIF